MASTCGVGGPAGSTLRGMIGPGVDVRAVVPQGRPEGEGCDRAGQQQGGHEPGAARVQEPPATPPALPDSGAREALGRRHGGDPSRRGRARRAPRRTAENDPLAPLATPAGAPSGGPEGGRKQAGIVACMSAAGAPPKLQVPRWIQLIALPLLLLAAWTLASAVRHALLIFLVSAVIAVLLNPIVHGLTRLRLPRGLAVLVVYLSFAAVLVGGVALVGAVVVDQTQSVSQQVQDEFTRHPGERESPAAQKVDRLQIWLDDHHLERVHVRDLGTEVVNNIEERGLSSYTKRALDITQTVATAIVEGLFNLVLILVISIYMLLDAPRISALRQPDLPPGPGWARADRAGAARASWRTSADRRSSRS